MSGSSAPIIRVEGLTVDYWDGERWVNVVRDVSFDIHPSEILGLAGESGCGKSTVAYSLLAERRPGSRIRSGRILLEGRDLLCLPQAELQSLRGGRASFVPQNPATSLTPSMRVGRQLVEVLEVHGVARGRAAHRQAIELIEAVGLPDAARVAAGYPHELSGGQQQRIVIAMALACRPAAIVLDEPTTGLDVTTQQRIRGLLAALREETGVAMLYVSHDLGALSQVCDRIAVMYAGELAEIAPVGELFAQPLHPYTRGLIGSVPRLDAPPDRAAMLSGTLKRSELPPGCRFAPRCRHVEGRCRAEEQTLETARQSHRVACRRWNEITAAAHG